ncbi:MULTISPECIES: TetR/AcrR family transcriptional regulator [unclassified Brenneria]|uniref:TetR/AcrR family transcriptional regulator n=1 Tax=unclassified Brenneria TaxID=2634434 RepID=UPI0029C26C49|nr:MULTISPECIES: TetR/AcrR family transcriptional regulator [unclassified Brenneria]MDX5628717.1 TetR/AcrR family transcriptional regulator [Brenneria sp. L3-3Z]MDX5695856.1 TetR/AcrR family transcriptional regulator [Brenneria sp. L4-2C]MEE3661144.1 TetR/AcrR family transcriptional regulator [Brenneria sp. g21c3]
MNTTDKGELTRRHILDTGRNLVLHKGFVGVGLKEILDASGVPKGSFYHYFSSKENFGCVLLEQYVDDYQQRLDTLLRAEDGSGRERLMRYWKAWIDDPVLGGWAEHCLVVKLAAEVADLSENMRLILCEGVVQLVSRIAETVADGQRDGSLPAALQAQSLAQTLYQLWLGAALLSKLARDKAPLHQALATTEHLLSPLGTQADV